MKLIDKDAVLAIIEKFMYDANQEADIASTGECFDEKVADAKYQLCKCIKGKINSLVVKEVYLEKELESFAYTLPHSAIGDGEHLGKFDDPKVKEARKNGWSHLWRYNYVKEIAKHFFELGLSVNNPITAADRGTAEEIIINLKRVEQDYRINLTKEIEWLRNQVKKGE